MFILKLNPQGSFIWVKQIGGPLTYVNPTSLKTDADGNVISTGHFSGTCDFDPDAVAVYNLSSNNGQVGYILKLDPSGNFIWANAFKGPYANVYSRSVSIDSMGGIYTTGSFQGTVDFDPGTGTYNLYSSRESGFVSRIDANGNFVWARTLTDRSYCIAQDKRGALYIGGQAIDGHSITKLSSMSDLIWRVNFGSDINACNTIYVDGLENIYTGGYFQGLTDFDPGAGTYILTPVSQTEMYVHKLNQSNILPVSFISLKGVAAKEGNQLSWIIPGETNAKYFEIEKSTNGIDFSFLKKLNVSSTGNRSSYSYLDVSPVAKVNYYRVRQMNKTNEVVLSGIIKIVSANKKDIKVFVSPNPSLNTISIISNYELKNATIRVCDANGKLLFRRINFNGSVLPLEVTNFKSGIYVVEVGDNGINYTTKFVKK